MASASCLLSEEQFLCSICLDVFTNPVSTPCGHNFCKTCITQHWDSDVLCRCPNCNKFFNTRPELLVNTFISEMAAQFRKSVQVKEKYEGKKAQLGKTGAEVQQMIQERQLKIQEIKHSVELSNEDADREIADSVEVFTALMSSIERSQAELIETIEEKQKSTEKKAEGLIKELKQEISELMKRNKELNHLHLLQGFPTLNTPPLTKDWTKVNVHQSYVGTVRRAVAQLEKTLNLEMKKLCDAELKRVQQYAVDVTLDPDTAHPYLNLSKHRKQVHHGGVVKNLQDNPERFSYCVSVLGKQSFSSGRFYFEVEVKGKTEWDLGVARESINRKGKITYSPKKGFWTIWLRNGNEYKALDDPRVLLSLRDKLQKVGVFVNHDEGLVSFYDVEARVRIYSYTGCTFSETLYPYFCPCPNDGGKNSAPLIISPVNHTD
ncbi:nuclear factor 7, ovary-like [Polymixia lowei]